MRTTSTKNPNKKPLAEARVNLKKMGQPIHSHMDALRRFVAGDRIFAAHEMGSSPVEIKHIEELNNWTPDQLLAVPQLPQLAQQDESRGTTGPKVSDDVKDKCNYLGKLKQDSMTMRDPDTRAEILRRSNELGCDQLVKEEPDVTEAGPFSYGYKKPRRGTVAYNAELKRKEHDRKTPAIEPRDQQVGVAKVTKGVTEALDTQGGITDTGWYDAYSQRPVYVRVKNVSGIGGHPRGTYVVQSFVRTSPTEAEFTIVHRGEPVTAEEDLVNPKTHLDRNYDQQKLFSFFSGKMPITARQAYNLMQFKQKAKEPGVTEGTSNKVHLKTPKHGLADHSGRNTGVGLRTFAATAESDRCPRCNSLYKNHYQKPGVTEGYILKKTSVSKYMEPGDPNEYTQDVNVKDTDYEIINNKTGQAVGTASWTTNDFFGPGALKIMMNNGATRWLDIWEREKGNPQSAFNRFVKDPKTAKKYKDQQGVTEGSGTVDQAQVVADKLTTDKNLAKLSAAAHDSTIYRALDRYFEKNGIPEAIYNRVASIVFKKLHDHGRRLTTDPTMRESGVTEGLVGDVVVHNYTKTPMDLKPGQVQIHGWDAAARPIYRVMGSDGKVTITTNKRKMMQIAQELGVQEGAEQGTKMSKTCARCGGSLFRFPNTIKCHKCNQTWKASPMNKESGVTEGLPGSVVFSGTGTNGAKYDIVQSSPTDFMIHANGKHIDTYSSLQRAMSVLKNEVPGLTKGNHVAETQYGTASEYKTQLDRLAKKEKSLPPGISPERKALAIRRQKLQKLHAAAQRGQPTVGESASDPGRDGSKKNVQ
jgi:hypothetical protein